MWIESYTWRNTENLKSYSFKCWYCWESVSSEKWYHVGVGFSSVQFGKNYICHSCNKPTFFDIDWKQYPWISFWEDVNNISDQLVSDIYDEARNCISTNSFTASVMCCRKLVMHVAVDKWADKWLNFVRYINYLEDNNLITQWAKEWVDEIRQLWNEANHEIKLMEEEEAKDLISFCEMLLRLNYDYPSRVRKKAPPSEG